MSSDNASNTLGFLSRHVFTTALWCAAALCVVVLLKGTVAVVRSLRNLWALEKVFPVPPRAHWLLGHMVFLSQGDRHIHEITSEWFRQYQRGYIFRHGAAMGRLVVTHPDDVRAVLMRTGDGLLLSSGPKWFRNRRLLTPGFHFEILKPYVRLFSESTNVMLDNWKDLKPGSSIDVFHYLSLMTLDSMLKCTLSQNTNCQTRHKAACSTVHKYSEEIIRQRKNALKKQSDGDRAKKYLDFLDILLRAKDEDGNGLTDAEIRDEVDTFMFEGHDTTASGLAWTLYCLARHPGHQEKCRKEAQEVLQGRTEVTWEDLPSMKYITLCVKESLRLYPAVPEILRTVETPLTFSDGRTVPEGKPYPKEYDPLRFSPENSKGRHAYAFVPFSAGPREDLPSMKYITLCVKESLRLYPAVPEILRTVETPLTFSDGRTLPEGSQVYINLRLLHRNPHIWEKPEEYDPLRFSPENSKGRHAYAFVPFSAGPRNCIGQHFAMNELKTAVALILQRFSLTPDDTLPEPVVLDRMVLRADSPGLYLKITPIEME
uniref:Uncharacterized protein n=1 Tax=Branchiostoma floridae TaxID=7739 RepID=C3XRR8_BRAFL|eukprot:XP_002613377.1 hypothetical protein BRAFLDRAFT_68363 [Branchiostoma floridae]